MAEDIGRRPPQSRQSDPGQADASKQDRELPPQRFPRRPSSDPGQTSSRHEETESSSHRRPIGPASDPDILQSLHVPEPVSSLELDSLQRRVSEGLAAPLVVRERLDEQHPLAVPPLSNPLFEQDTPTGSSERIGVVSHLNLTAVEANQEDLRSEERLPQAESLPAGRGYASDSALFIELREMTSRPVARLSQREPEKGRYAQSIPGSGNRPKVYLDGDERGLEENIELHLSSTEHTPLLSDDGRDTPPIIERVPADRPVSNQLTMRQAYGTSGQIVTQVIVSSFTRLPMPAIALATYLHMMSVKEGDQRTEDWKSLTIVAGSLIGLGFGLILDGYTTGKSLRSRTNKFAEKLSPQSLQGNNADVVAAHWPRLQQAADAGLNQQQAFKDLVDGCVLVLGSIVGGAIGGQNVWAVLPAVPVMLSGMVFTGFVLLSPYPDQPDEFGQPPGTAGRLAIGRDAMLRGGDNLARHRIADQDVIEGLTDTLASGGNSQRNVVEGMVDVLVAEDGRRAAVKSMVGGAGLLVTLAIYGTSLSVAASLEKITWDEALDIGYAGLTGSVGSLMASMSALRARWALADARRAAEV